MSSTKTPGGRNSEISTKELGANPDTLTRQEAKRKRRNRDRQRRRREKEQNSEESKAATHNAVVSAEDNGGSGVSGWRMSSALGGRFLPLDMVFSEDEQ